MRPMSDVARRRDLYRRELPQRLDEVFKANPSLVDHRAQFPWVLSCLGDPLASAWFIAEIPA